MDPLTQGHTCRVPRLSVHELCIHSVFLERWLHQLQRWFREGDVVESHELLYESLQISHLTFRTLLPCQVRLRSLHWRTTLKYLTVCVLVPDSVIVQLRKGRYLSQGLSFAWCTSFRRRSRFVRLTAPKISVNDRWSDDHNHVGTAVIRCR